MISIKHRFTGVTLCEFDVETVKEAVLLGIKAGSDLRDSDLRGSDLSGCNLSYSNLRGSNLSYSDLSGSNLRGSNLSGSDLRDSDLSGCNLIGSNLSYSNLSYSDLRGSNIEGEKITINPISIAGLRYWCLITDGFMRLGCKRFTHKEWADFNDKQISEMDSHALEFWMQWKEPLISMCAKHAGAA